MVCPDLNSCTTQQILNVIENLPPLSVGQCNVTKCFYQLQQNRSYEWLPSREFSHSAANNVTPELILNKDIVLFDEDDDYEEHFQEAQLNEEAC